MDSEHDLDWTSGDEEPSMREMVRGLTNMMTSLNSRMNQMDGGRRKKGKVSFRGARQEGETSTPSGTTSMAAAPPSTSQQPPIARATELAYTHETQPLPAPAPAPGSTMETESVTTTSPLPDVSEAVRTRVAQCLQGAPDSFLLADEDSPSDEDTSPGKRKRPMKSGKLRTRDTHVVIRIKWPHEVVRSALSKAPVYEELSLASFTNGYLGIVAEEKGSAVGEVMLTHLRALLQDVDMYGWRVVRDFHAAWLQLLEQGRATWMDEGERTELRRLMVWSKPSLASRASNPPPTQAASTGSQHPLAYANQGRAGRNNDVPSHEQM